MVSNQPNAQQNTAARGPGDGSGNVDVVGMWVTADGHIRQKLLPDGLYDEARSTRSSAYTGRYTVTGNHLHYVDDTGFTATAPASSSWSSLASAPPAPAPAPW